MTTPLTPIPARLEDLRANVSQDDPVDGEALVWVASTSQWTPQALPAAPVASVFGRTGNVVAQSGDYAAADITGLTDALASKADAAATTAALATKADDSAVVHKTGAAQSIDAATTFTTTTTFATKARVGRTTASPFVGVLEVQAAAPSTTTFTLLDASGNLALRVLDDGQILTSSGAISASANIVIRQTAGTGTFLDFIGGVNFRDASNGFATMIRVTSASLQTNLPVLFRAASTTTADQPQGRLEATWATSTHATRKGRCSILASDFTGTDKEGVRVESDGSKARVSLATPASAPVDANVPTGQVAVWLDESANKLMFRVRYSNGTTLKSGEIALT